MEKPLFERLFFVPVFLVEDRFETKDKRLLKGGANGKPQANTRVLFLVSCSRCARTSLLELTET